MASPSVLLKASFSALTLSASLLAQQQLPNPPKVYLNTQYPTVTGQSITVNAGGDLQAAINSANPGDEIVLQAGATWTGNYSLPNKVGGSWIIIRSSAKSFLPPSGTRVTPSNAANMPKIVTPNSNPAIANNYAVAGSRTTQFWYLEGLEITTSAPLTWNVVLFDDEYSLAPGDMPHDITISHCYIHGIPNTAGMVRGVWLGGVDMAVVDSWVSDFQDTNMESQAVVFQDGPGPFKIVNNELEAATENLMFLDPPPTSTPIIPSDVEIRGNHIMKPLTYQGSPYTVKNLFEIKNGQRILFSNNVLENCWPMAQTGMAIVAIPRTNNGLQPYSLVQDVTITYNVIRNVGGGINIAGLDDTCPPTAGCQTSHRVLLQNNLFYEVTTAMGGPGYVFEIANMHELTVDHNTTQTVYPGTIQPWGQFIVTYPTVNEIVTNNIFDQNIGGQAVVGPASLFNSSQTGSSNSGNSLSNNLMIGQGFDGYLTSSAVTSQWNPYAVATFYATDTDAVGYNNPAAGNYSLIASSPYKNAGTDGKDLGYNASKINISRVISGGPGAATAPQSPQDCINNALHALALSPPNIGAADQYLNVALSMLQ